MENSETCLTSISLVTSHKLFADCFSAKESFAAVAVKSPTMNEKLSLKKNLTGIVEVTVKSAFTSHCSKSRCASRKVLPAAEDNFLASLPRQLTVALEKRSQDIPFSASAGDSPAAESSLSKASTSKTQRGLDGWGKEEQQTFLH